MLFLYGIQISTMIKSYWRGYKIKLVDDIWIYVDNGMAVDSDPDRKCGYCNKENTKEGHDPCLGILDGVMNACCGHGIEREAWVQFLDGSRMRGEEAIEYMKEMK